MNKQISVLLELPLFFPERCGIVIYSDGGSSNGRTEDSDSSSLGSNPSPPANLNTLRPQYAVFFFCLGPFRPRVIFYPRQEVSLSR